MTWINKANGRLYSFGALQTDEGVIFNPTQEVLKAHGYEPYVAPVVLSRAEIEQARKQAYIQRVDPITAEISRLRDMGGTDAEIAEAMARREQEVSAIKAELPYPSEGAE